MTAQDREDFILMKIDVKYTKEYVKDMHSKVEDMSNDFKNIKFHLIGDADTDTKGWIWKLGRYDVRLTRIEKATAIGAGLFSASCVYLVFIKNLLGIF